jgi:hypothetical protein
MRTTVLVLSFAIVASLAYPQDPPAPPIKIGRIAIGKKKADSTTTNVKSDADILKSAGLKPDDANNLVSYFKSRTLSDDQMTSISAAIKRMGDEKYREREKASSEVVKFGAAALGPLKNAIATDPDAEIVFRAEEARRTIETVSQATVAVSAAKMLAKLKSPDAAPAILAFLPTADSEAVAEELRNALTSLAMKDGKPEESLINALGDSSAARRSAAAVALVEGARTPESLAKVKAMVAGEKDVEVKFATAVSLIAKAKDVDSVPTLISLLPDTARGRVWQTEDLLLQLAGDKAPKVTFGKTKDSLEKYRDEWLKWWQANGKSIDFAKFDFKPRTDGCLVLVEWNQQGWGNGNVTILGPNLKEKVKLTGLAQPVDAVTLPGNRIAVAEQNNSRITIRDYTNEILTTIQVQQPMGLQLLPSGKLFVAMRNGCAEYDLDGKRGWNYDRANNNHDLMSARRLPNGETILFINSDQKNNCIRIDKDGKEIGKPFPLGQPYYQPSVEGINNDEFYITDYNKIQKYSLKENKVTWTHNANGVTGLQKLPNGNLLYVAQQTNKIVELTPNKEEVWDYQLTTGMRLAKAYRR